MATSKRMTFQRFGRSHHLRIRSAEDLAAAAVLDEAHWVATGAPIDTINCDRTFLELFDTDNNGRLMCFEVIAGIEWLGKVLADASGVTECSDVLRLASINTDEPDGRSILASAEKMLDSLGAPEAGEISLQQIRRIKTQVEGTPVSEAGVVLPGASNDPQVQRMLADIIATVGGTPHPSGANGVNQGEFEEFQAAAKAHLDWLDQGEIPAGAETTEIMPLGATTGEAFALYAKLRGKIDQYFAQCEAVAFDARTADRVIASDDELQSLDLSDPEAIAGFIRSAPLAKPTPAGMLPFEADVNPSYVSPLGRLRKKVIEPALGQAAPSISREQWWQVKSFLSAHEAWASAKAGAAVEALGAEKLRAYIAPKMCDAVKALVAESAETAFVLDNIRLTEKLALYQANLLDLANNFVSFPHLYDSARRAMFEMGSLVMDNRRFNLAVRVADRAAHATIAKTGNMFVLYAEVAPGDGAEKFEVAVPVTSGGKGNLCVGKRGVFQEVNGRESDARIVGMIENPISIREALVSPFKRLGRLLSGKIEAITASAEKKLDTAAASAVSAPKTAAAPAQPAKAAGGGMMAGGLLMGGGVAIAALSSAAAYMAKTLVGFEWWQIVLGVAIAILAVIVPTSLLAILKLRRRDISAILEGSGWAINARMRLTRGQCRFFTCRPAYPANAKGVRRPWVLIVAVLIFWAIAVGVLAWIRANR